MREDFVGTVWQRFVIGAAGTSTVDPQTARPVAKVSDVTSPPWSSPPGPQPYGGARPGSYPPPGSTPGWGQPNWGQSYRQPGFPPPPPGSTPYGQPPSNGPVGPSFGGPQSTVPYYGSSPQSPPPRRRNPLAAVLLGMVVLVVLALAGLALASCARQHPPGGVPERRLRGTATRPEPTAAPAAHHLRRGGGLAHQQRALRPVGAGSRALRQCPDQRRRRRRPAARGSLQRSDGVPGPGLAAAADVGGLGDRPADGHDLRQGDQYEVRQVGGQRLLLLGRSADLLQQSAARVGADRPAGQVGG